MRQMLDSLPFTEVATLLTENVMRYKLGLKSFIEKLSPHKGLYMELRSQHGSFLVVKHKFSD